MCRTLYMFLLLNFLITVTTESALKIKKCGPLKSQINVELSCFTIKRFKRLPLADCGGPQLTGTFMTYDCKDFYTSLNTIRNSFDSHSNELFCDETGNWIGLKRYNDFRCKEDCGRISQNAKPLIINGVETNRTLWPWHATLFEMRGTSWSYICGGTLIRNQVVVTAAHCIVRHVNQEPNPKEFRIVLGAMSPRYLENAIDSETRIHKVVRVYISENYDPSKGYQADIAILHLEGNVEFSESIIPICLPNDYSVEASAVKPGVSGKVAGFGFQETGKLAKTLHSIELEVRTGIECFTSLQRVLSESQFCAGTTSRGEWKTLCNGDSGGGISFLSTVHQRYHIHGITSSGDVEKGRCQNYAVFTRIYSFIFWIRDVIEEISGEIARDLHAHVPYPYSLDGTENTAVVFRSLPREWENKITTFSLDFVDVDPGILLESLEFAQTLVSFNISRVELVSGIFPGKRILLPHLSTFQMDILQNHWKLRENRNFPEDLTVEYLKKFIFFEKGFGTLGNWKSENLLQLGTNIQLTLGIFKVLHVDKEQGLVALNSVPFAESILSSLLESRSDFILRSLAIARCEFQILRKISRSSLTSLTINDVTLDETDFIDSIRLMTQLTVLRVSLPQGRSLRLNIADVSDTLRVLSLSGNIAVEAEAGPTNSKVFFALRSFMCDFCTFSSALVEKIQTLFPNLRLIVIRSFTTPSLTFGSIQIFPGRFYYLVKSGDAWKSLRLSDVQIQKALFSGRNEDSFWTSEQEYRARRRLKTYEKIAMDTGVFSFRGKGNSESEELKGIPIPVQQNMKVLRLSSVRMYPTTLRNSISQAPLLKEIILENLNFQTRSITVHFKLETISWANESFSFITEHFNGNLHSIIFPLSNVSSSTSLFHTVLTEFNAVQIWANTSTIFWLDAIVDDMAEPLRIIRRNANVLRTDDRYRQFNWDKFYRLSDYVFFGSEFMPPNFESPGMLLFDDYFVDTLDKYPIILRFLRNRPFLAQHNKWISSRAPFISDVAASKWLHKLDALPVGSSFALSLLQNQLSTVIY